VAARVKAVSTTLVAELAKYHALAQAAKAVGVSRVTVWKWLKTGKLVGYRVGWEVLIEKTVVDEIRTKRCTELAKHGPAS